MIGEACFTETMSENKNMTTAAADSRQELHFLRERLAAATERLRRKDSTQHQPSIPQRLPPKFHRFLQAARRLPQPIDD